MFTVTAKGEDRCRACGKQPTGGGLFGSLHLHHVIPKSMCRATRWELRNGIPLCYECHGGWHDRRVVLYRDVFTEEEWSFLVTVDLLGQNVEAWLEDHYPERGLPLRS